jgi:hypothetical protein
LEKEEQRMTVSNDIPLPARPGRKPKAPRQTWLDEYGQDKVPPVLYLLVGTVVAAPLIAAFAILDGLVFRYGYDVIFRPNFPKLPSLSLASAIGLGMFIGWVTKQYYKDNRTAWGMIKCGLLDAGLLFWSFFILHFFI